VQLSSAFPSNRIGRYAAAQTSMRRSGDLPNFEDGEGKGRQLGQEATGDRGSGCQRDPNWLVAEFRGEVPGCWERLGLTVALPREAMSVKRFAATMFNHLHTYFKQGGNGQSELHITTAATVTHDWVFPNKLRRNRSTVPSIAARCQTGGDSKGSSLVIREPRLPLCSF
jgi:hypothetical protein